MPIQLLLDTAATRLTETGWGKTLSARQFVVDGEMDSALWREPITGALMLRPAPLSAEWRESEDFESYKPAATAFHRQAAFWETIYTKSAGKDPFLSTLYPAGADPADIALPISVDLDGLKTDHGEELVWALQSKASAKANQGFYLETRHFGFDFEKASNYLVVAFGQYALRLQTDGMAILFKYESNSWTQRKEMRFCGQSEQHGNSLSLLVLPILGNRLHFYFSTGRAVNAAFDHERTPGPSDEYHSYRLPLSEEHWDQDAGLWRVTDEGPLRVALSPGRRYFLQLAGVVFAEGEKTAVLGHDDIHIPRTNAPTVTLHGYMPGDSSATATVLDRSTGLIFDPGTDTLPQPSVTLAASSNRVWSPELHAVTLDLSPKTAIASPVSTDVGADVLRLRVRLSNTLAAQSLDVVLRDPFVEYAPGLTCSLTLAGQTVFGGSAVESLVDGSAGTGRLRFRDGWERLEAIRLGPEIAYDGLEHTEVVRRLLRRAGFPDTAIEISEDEGRLPGGGGVIPVSPAANDWRFAPKSGDTPAGILRLLAREFSGWGLRDDGGVWRYQPRPMAAEATRFVYVKSADYNTSMVNAADRIRAFRIAEATAAPEFNAITVYGMDASGGEPRRVQAFEQNAQSIGELGWVEERHRTAGWAPTVGSCARVARNLLTERGRTRHVLRFDGEWKPGFLPDAIVEVQDMGVFRLDEVEIVVARDRDELYVARYMATKVEV